MLKIFTLYCASVAILMTVANYNHISIWSLASGKQTTSKTANRYHK
jgi:hypothetical protein